MEKSITLKVFGKEIPTNEFVEKLYKALIFAMITSLRVPELSGNEKIHIEITND